MVCGYRIYERIWDASIGEKLLCESNWIMKETNMLLWPSLPLQFARAILLETILITKGNLQGQRNLP